MRCADVIQELAAPNRPDPAALAEHLARCPRCAAWARQGARLDRLWDATRPEEPAPATWATVWAQVNQSLDSAAPTSPSPRIRPSAAPHPRPWRRRTVALFAIAQAAVLLVAAWLVSGPDPGRPVQAATAEVEIPYGAVVLIQSGPKGVTVISHDADEAPIADGDFAMLNGPVDGNFVALNTLEGMAE